MIKRVIVLAAALALTACGDSLTFEEPSRNVADTTQIKCVRIIAGDTTCIRLGGQK